MFEAITHEWRGKVLLVLTLFFLVWWISFQSGAVDNPQRQLFGTLYGSIALISALWGLHISKKWGGMKSLMGRAIIFFSLGLLAQEFGQLAYSFYTYFLHVEVPYPSLGDIGYFASIPLYSYGAILIGKVAGARVEIKSLFSKIQALLIPVLLLVISYIIFLNGYVFDWSQPLTIFLDFGYPLGGAIYISLALIAYLFSRNVLGGVMKNKILLLIIALAIQFVADFTFLYLSYKDLAYPGSIIDLIYLLAYFFMGFAILHLKVAASKLQSHH